MSIKERNIAAQAFIYPHLQGPIWRLKTPCRTGWRQCWCLLCDATKGVRVTNSSSVPLRDGMTEIVKASIDVDSPAKSRS